MTERKVGLAFRKWDLIAAALVLLLSAACFLVFMPREQAPENARVEIWLDGVKLASLPLDEDAEFAAEEEYRSLVRIENGAVRIAQSNCPGLDCVHLSAISRPGRTLVCLPNRVEVKITATDADTDDGVDFVVR